MRLPSFGVQVALGMATGLVLGLIARELMQEAGAVADTQPLVQFLHTIGNSFIQILKAIVPPLVVTAIIASVARLRTLDNPSRLVGQTLLWFAITAAISVLIGLTLGLLIRPGEGVGGGSLSGEAPRTVGGWLDFLQGLIPANIFGLTASTKIVEGVASTTLSFNVLQLVVIATVIGAAAVRSGERAASFLAWNEAALAIIRTILGWVVRLTPIGTAGLFGSAVATLGWDALVRLGWFAATVYTGLGIVLLGLYPALLIAHRLNPARFFAHVWPAMQLGFVSRSSVGTLPFTEAAVERMGVAPAYAAFSVPLAATTKMDGCAAIYPAAAALFVAQYYGLPLGLTDYALILAVSVIGSAATAGVTGALVMLTLTLSTLGLPLEGAGLLLAIDPILDMGRTAVNVTGQALVSLIVAKREGLLDESRFNATDTVGEEAA